MKENDLKTQTGRLLYAAQAKYKHIEIPADLVRHLGIDHQRFTNWKRRGIASSQLFDLAEEFDCDPQWLASGKGAMKNELQELNIDIKNPDFIALVKLWNETPIHLQPHLRSLAGTIQQITENYGVEKKEVNSKNGTKK